MLSLQAICDRIILQLDIMYLMIQALFFPGISGLISKQEITVPKQTAFSVVILKDTDIRGDSLKSVKYFKCAISP